MRRCPRFPDISILLLTLTITSLAPAVASADSFSYAWSRVIGTTNTLGVDPWGNVIVAGGFGGTLDFGGGPLTSAGNTDVFIAKYTPGGIPLWSERFGDEWRQSAIGVATDSFGNIIVSGEFTGTLDLGGGPLVRGGNSTYFIAKFDPDGNHIWSKTFTSVIARHHGIAVDPDGNLLVTGSFAGTSDVGGGPLTSAGRTDILVAKLDGNGNHVWSKRFGDASYDESYSVASGAAGDVHVTGAYWGTIDFGDGVFTTSGGTSGIFIASFDADGTPTWSHGFGGDAMQGGADLAVDPSQNVLLTGYFHGSVDFGGGVLTAAGDDGSCDVFVTKFDAGGTHLWSRRVGEPILDDNGYDIGCDQAGNVFVTGAFSSTMLYFELGPSGDDKWRWTFSPSGQYSEDMELDPSGNVVMTCYGSPSFDPANVAASPLVGVRYIVKFERDQPVAATFQEYRSLWERDHAEIVWRLADVEGVLTFEIERREGRTGERFTILDDAPIARGPAGEFRFDDHTTTPSTTYTYRVTALGQGRPIASFETTLSTPASALALFGNIPNPFNPTTTIRFSLDRATRASLSIYTIEGKNIATLVDAPLGAGVHAVPWDGMDDNGQRVASGVYLYRLRAGSRSLVRKMVLLK